MIFSAPRNEQRRCTAGLSYTAVRSTPHQDHPWNTQLRRYAQRLSQSGRPHGGTSSLHSQRGWSYPSAPSKGNAVPSFLTLNHWRCECNTLLTSNTLQLLFVLLLHWPSDWVKPYSCCLPMSRPQFVLPIVLLSYNIIRATLYILLQSSFGDKLYCKMFMVCIISAEDHRVHRRGGGEPEGVGSTVSAAAPSRDPHQRRHRGVRRVYRFPLHPLTTERARHLRELCARRQRPWLHARAR